MNRTLRILVGLMGSLTLAVAQPSAQTTSTTLDRMTADGKSSQELARYVFDSHGCKS